MIKPLLRTIAKLSGNVKLACNLTDYTLSTNWDGSKVYEANIRYAKLLPLSSATYQKKIDAGLLGSSWEFDLKKFYDTYSDIFYSDCFTYNPKEILYLDSTIEQKTRNTDFEYGVKRISYSKNGNQFALFAPFYTDKELPAYFLLNIKLSNNVYDIDKQIKINITANSDSKFHYLGRYLQKYVQQINNDVVFCQPLTKQASYYGIDVQHGGFAKIIDNAISRLYTIQNTIHNFDSILVQGFERNKIVMKQILPLAFYFNINDFLTPQEQHRYKNQNISFSGAYYDEKNNEIPFYDFSADYDVLHHQILEMSDDYGSLIWKDGNVNNIMDVNFPSLNECRYINYQFANKLSTNFCRWKLKYSDDEHPYIANMSWAFSKNQNSNYRYGEFPVSFQNIEGLCNYLRLSTSNYQYNLIFPFSSSKYDYDKYDTTIAKRYKTIQDEYCLNWFEAVHDITDKSLFKLPIWRDIDGTCVYYNGILYDLANVYDKSVDPIHLDKFAVIVNPNPNIMTISDLQRLKFANYTLYRQSGSRISNSNVNANDSVLSMFYGHSDESNYIYRNEGWDPDKIYQDQLSTNKIYTYAYASGNFIDLNDIGLDYYELNKYYDSSEITSAISYIDSAYLNVAHVESERVPAYFLSAYYGNLFDQPEEAAILGYLQLPVYKSKLLTYSSVYDKYKPGDIGFSPARNSYVLNVPDLQTTGAWLKDNLTVRSFDEYTNIFNHAYIMQPYNGKHYGYLHTGKHDYENVLYGNMFYTKHKFYKGSYIDILTKHDFEPAYLKAYINTKHAQDIADEEIAYSYWNYEDIFDLNNYDEHGNVKNSYAYAAYLWTYTNNYKHRIGSYLQSYLDSHLSATEYQFNPICENNSSIYATDVFTERTAYTSKFYGDVIPEGHNTDDMDVLWSDIYNLNNLFDKYAHVQVDLSPENTCTFYTRFLNKEHIYYYYVELFKDENARYKNYLTNINTDRLKEEDVGLLMTETSRPLCVEYSDDYQDWLMYDWFETIYIKQKVWINDQSAVNHPVVRIAYKKLKKHWKDTYGQESDFNTFMTWYTLLRYDVDTDLFYYVDEPDEKFELVFSRMMYRVDTTLWDITKISHIDENGIVVINNESNGEHEDLYRDIYFYRIQSPVEYDNKYGNILKIQYLNSVKDASNEYDDIREIDTCLIPMFTDIFAQPSSEALIYTYYILNNINIVWNETTKTNNYRYNKNDKNVMLEITDWEREFYGITKTYNEYDETYSELVVEYDDLGYGDYMLNTYVDPETGEKYGFYIIRANFNNTSNSFLLTGVVDDTYIYNIKYIHYINGINVLENPEYITSIFKQVAPFINLKMLQQLENIKTIIYPGTYNIELFYSQSKANNSNSSNEIDIFKHTNKVKKLMLTRYMHSFTPLIQKVINIDNVYRLKLKDVDMSMLSTGKYNSIGDSIIYKSNEHISIAPEYRVYSSSKDERLVPHYNNWTHSIMPLEQKHFNASYALNLEEHFEIKVTKKFKYAELEQAQSYDKTLELFTSHINANRKNKFKGDDVLFLIKKYRVEYDTTSIGLTLDKKEKLYSLTYKFTLL